MKSYELMPTLENLCETYKSDAIGRNKDIKLFSKMLNSLTGFWSIAIDGKWGSGKTFFVKQVKLFMDAQNDFINVMSDDVKSIFKEDEITDEHNNSDENFYQPQVSVYYDAWENDNDNDPILSLIYLIISNIDTDFTLKSSDTCIKKAASILELFSGKNVSGLIDSFESKDLLADIRKSKDLKKKIESFLDSLLPERGNRLIVFIDELDRCNPSYAVKLLERIKHYFTNDRITFVFSINAFELQNTIKKFYGESFDACKYLDRFFDLRISLPPINMYMFYKSIGFNNSIYIYDKVSKAVIENYDFSLREISKYLMLINTAAHKVFRNDDRYDFVFYDGQAKLICLTHIVPIMLGLKIHSINMYDDFVSGRDCSPLIEVVSRLSFNNLTPLLDQNETFNKNATSQSYISISEKLKQLYNAIFCTIYSENNQNTYIGDCKFNNETKKWLFRVVSLLSDYTTIEADDKETENG